MKGERSENAGAAASPGTPAVSLPTGGGALRAIGEKVSINPVTGSAHLNVPLPLSPGRSGFTPDLSLSYDSGAGNGPFGIGWCLSLPSISRRTERSLPRYDDSDVFLFAGEEDLVPALVEVSPGVFEPDEREQEGHIVQRFRPRVEGLFARIERWSRITDGDVHWRSLSRDNTLAVYGFDTNSRIYDPADPRRVFRWLISESYDCHGNAAAYDYLAEDHANVDLSRAGEVGRERSANRYLGRVRYGNRRPLLVDETRESFRRSHLPRPDLDAAGWMFEVVFDYGQGSYHADPPNAEGRVFATATTTADPAPGWPARADAFSVYRAGFEVRTHRLCRRVLTFHHFDELGAADTLVRALHFEYRERSSAAALTKITESGYRRFPDGRYLERSLPSLELAYTESSLERACGGRFRRSVQSLDDTSRAGLPAGVDGRAWQWVDLDAEGIAGALAVQSQAWYWKRNLGGGRLAPVEVLDTLPSFTVQGRPAGGAAGMQLLDLEGNGTIALVDVTPGAPGFFARKQESSARGWDGFRAFGSWPNFAWSDGRLRFVDLTGDGRADALMTDGASLIWYPSLGSAGFGPGVRVALDSDERKSPRVVFDDEKQTVLLADLSGDGLLDLVRVRNGEVCYWPNLGYGRFGAKVTMDRAPHFDAPDLFDPRRLRVADVDGSGTADLVYIGRDAIRVYLNQSGNAWSEACIIEGLPASDDPAAVSIVDLLGRGTACLCWSSALPSDARSPFRYVDIMAGQKPHLLVGSRNNRGGETTLQWTTSTELYLADKAAGTPWVTRLPFPIHVVKRTITYDAVSRNRFVSSYSYHHGHFDGIDREFRGFGRVDHVDSEELGALASSAELPPADNLGAASHVPPVLTVSWFHTGRYEDGPLTSRQYEHEYYREGDASRNEAPLSRAQRSAISLGESVLIGALSAREHRAAARALKGMPLRREVYSLDGSEAARRPYLVEESNYTIQVLQPAGARSEPVLLTTAREGLRLAYERVLHPTEKGGRADPRVTHTLALETDAFGNRLRSVSVAYGRRLRDPHPHITDEDRAEQAKTRVTLNETSVSAPLSLDDAYRAPVACETRTFELSGALPCSAEPEVTNLFRLDELAALVAEASDGMHDLAYTDLEGAAMGAPRPHRRRIDHTRTMFRRDDLTGPLPLGRVGALGLPFERQKLALDAAHAEATFVATGKLTASELSTALTEAGYVHAGGDRDWWVTSHRAFLSPDPADAPPDELAWALGHFFLPHREHDPFGNISSVFYDSHCLLPTLSRDPLGNVVTAGERDASDRLTTTGNDYRVLQPALVMDANRNRAAVAFDALGMVAGSALMGKAEAPLGDSLQDFDPDPPAEWLRRHLADPLANPAALLQNASRRLLFDPLAYARDGSALVSASIARTEHVARSQGSLPFVQTFCYYDGMGREIQSKVQTAPGPLVEGGPPLATRWITSSWKVFNNKGAVVREYQPRFEASHAFSFGNAAGHSPIVFYDPLGRPVGVLHPDHSWQKVRHDPWRRESWDRNDTLLVDDPRRDPDLGAYFARLPSADYLPTWHQRRAQGALGSVEADAARETELHAGTPELTFLDPMGRCLVTLEHNRVRRSRAEEADGSLDEHYRTRLHYDIEGNLRAIVDPLGRTIVRYETDLLGNRIHALSMDAGARWLLADAAGKPVHVWDARGHHITTSYDRGSRPLTRTVRGSDPRHSDPRTLCRDVLFEKLEYGEDQANATANNLRSRLFRRFDGSGVKTAERYDLHGNAVSISQAFASDYKSLPDWSQSPAVDHPFTSGSTFDALNRLTTMTTPDGSVVRMSYDPSGRLTSVAVQLRGAATVTELVREIGYNARGDRTRLAYANVASSFEYDPLTFELSRLLTTRGPGARGQSAGLPLIDAGRVQDLRFTRDPLGHVTRADNAALESTAKGVESAWAYCYDAVYRLTEARGREHAAQAARNFFPADGNYRDYPLVGAAEPSAPLSLRPCRERYDFDGAGNLTRLEHHSRHHGWVRDYTYAEPSLCVPSQTSNRLTKSALSDGLSEAYSYDPHGAITRMPHLPVMQWSFKQELQAASRQVAATPEMTYFNCDLEGRRMRKVTERDNGTRACERLYLQGWELYREYAADGMTVTATRESLHVHAGATRVAIIETETDQAGRVGAPDTRYPIAGPLGSICLELDERGAVLSYEEYTPFGTSAWQAGTRANLGRKRYRYTARERDRETGLAVHGVRHYAPWLGRWTSADPAGLVAGDNETYSVSCKQLDEKSRRQPLSVRSSRFSPCDPILWRRSEQGEPRARRPPTESAASWNLYAYAKDDPIGHTDIGGMKASSAKAPVKEKNNEPLLLGLALGAVIIGSAITIWWLSQHGKGSGSGWEWLLITLIPLLALTAVAFFIAAFEEAGTIKTKKKGAAEGKRITAVEEGGVFDLWAFFHYLVPALVSTGITMGLSQVKGLSAESILAISAGGTMLVVAFGWELLERHIGAGKQEAPSNIVGDVVIGTLGAATASYGFLIALGRKIDGGYVVGIGLTFATIGGMLTGGALASDYIVPHA